MSGNKETVPLGVKHPGNDIDFSPSPNAVKTPNGQLCLKEPSVAEGCGGGAMKGRDAILAKDYSNMNRRNYIWKLI